MTIFCLFLQLLVLLLREILGAKRVRSGGTRWRFQPSWSRFISFLFPHSTTFSPLSLYLKSEPSETLLDCWNRRWPGTKKLPTPAYINFQHPIRSWSQSTTVNFHLLALEKTKSFDNSLSWDTQSMRDTSHKRRICLIFIPIISRHDRPCSFWVPTTPSAYGS